MLTMPRLGVLPSTGADSDSECAAATHQTEAMSGERQSVSELVKSYSDPPSEGQKRDRSESGDPAPAGKRGARERRSEPDRSPSAPGGRTFKESLDTAFEELENRVMSLMSRELHEFRERLSADIEKLNDRVHDLERHVEERDGLIDRLSDELRQSRKDISALQTRVEEAEVNSRLPCLVLSGAAMAPRRTPRLDTPLSARTAPAEAGASQPATSGQGQAVTSRPADGQVSAGRRGPGDPASVVRGGSVVRGEGGAEEREDVNALVINTLNKCMPGINLNASDIDRAHRLPGPNHKVIVRFVRSGRGSVRDEVITRRLELRGRDLYVNESLTKLRGLIFRSLLAAKRESRVYTVYSRGGNVYFKEKQHGVSTRVDSLQRLRDLGYAVLDR